MTEALVSLNLSGSRLLAAFKNWKRTVKRFYRVGSFMVLSLYPFFILKVLGLTRIDFIPEKLKLESTSFVIIPGITVPFFDSFFLLFAVLVSLAFHEFGHSLAAFTFDVDTKRVVLTIIYAIPAAFVELDPESFSGLTSDRQRIIVTSGIFHNLLLCFMIWLFFMQPESNFGATVVSCNEDYISGLRGTFNLAESEVDYPRLNNIVKPGETVSSILSVTMEQDIANAEDFSQSVNRLMIDLPEIEMEDSNLLLRFSAIDDPNDFYSKKLLINVIASKTPINLSIKQQLIHFFSGCKVSDSRPNYVTRMLFRSFSYDISWMTSKFAKYTYNISLSLGFSNLLPIKILGFDGYLIWKTFYG